MVFFLIAGILLNDEPLPEISLLSILTISIMMLSLFAFGLLLLIHGHKKNKTLKKILNYNDEQIIQRKAEVKQELDEIYSTLLTKKRDNKFLLIIGTIIALSIIGFFTLERSDEGKLRFSEMSGIIFGIVMWIVLIFLGIVFDNKKMNLFREYMLLECLITVKDIEEEESE
jgi:hypothetical protein